MNRTAWMVAAVLAAVVVPAAPVDGAQALQSTGPPEAVSSPLTRTDPRGDCLTYYGAAVAGPRCDLLSIKVVNQPASVKLIATYAGTPFLPAVQNSGRQGVLGWELEGATDSGVTISRGPNGTLGVSVTELPYVGGPSTCWSGDGDLAPPVLSGQRLSVVVPRDCLGDLQDVRVYASTTMIPPLGVGIDRVPNAGYTARVSIRPSWPPEAAG